MLHILEIIIFGSLSLLSFLLLANPFKVNAKANRWLGAFLLLWATYWLEEIIRLATGISLDITGMPVLSTIQFLSPLVFFMCIKYFTNPNFKLKTNGLFYFIVPFIYLVVAIIEKTTSSNLISYRISLTFLHSLYFLLASYYTIYKHQKQIKRFSSNMTGIDLYWLEYIVIVMFTLLVVITIFNILFFKAPLNTIMNVVTLFVVFFVAYNSLKQKEIYPIDEQDRFDTISVSQIKDDELHKRRLISDERLIELKAQLNELMIKEEPYLDSELNLISLSKQLQISSNHLSYVINTGYDENFYGYINKFRVEKAKQLLLDKKVSHLSIIGVAYESGFSSKTSFNTTFKKITGLTPSEFRKRSSDM